jgi:hypothetical protein
MAGGGWCPQTVLTARWWGGGLKRLAMLQCVAPRVKREDLMAALEFYDRNGGEFTDRFALVDEALEDDPLKEDFCEALIGAMVGDKDARDRAEEFIEESYT